MGSKIYKPSPIIYEEEKIRIHKEIEAAQSRPIEYDEDCPELTPEMLKQLKSSVRNRKRARELKA